MWVLNKFSFPSFSSNHFARRPENFKLFREGEEVTLLLKRESRCLWRKTKKTVAVNRGDLLACCEHHVKSGFEIRPLKLQRDVTGTA